MGLRPHPGVSDEVLELDHCSVAVSLDPIRRTLEREHFDAVVSSDDSMLSMSGGVSGELRDLGGPAFVAEAQKLVPVAIGSVAVTPPGAIPVRHVLHAVTVDWVHDIRPTERTLRHLGREIFVRCEGLGVRSVLVPAVAAGAAGFSVGSSARIIVDCLREHLRNPSILERVVFSLPDAEAYLHFKQALFPTTDLPSLLDERGLTATLTLPSAPRAPEERVARARGWWPWARRPRKSATTDPYRRPALPESLAPHAEDTRAVLGKRYVLLEELGRGGFGTVDLAWDLILRRNVAIKRLHRDLIDPEFLRREAALAMDLTHEGIVRLYHFEPRAGDRDAFLVMEFIPWSTGEKWISDAGQAGLPPRVVLEVGVRACDALAYAHGRGILHLDIKPGNLFVDAAADRAKLVDFGLARAVAPGRGAFQLVPAGTPAFMPPEQLTPGGRLTPATDVFQLTATIWDLLTGDAPSHVFGATLETIRSRGWPSAFEALVGGLAPDPRDRPRDASELKGLIEGALAAVS